MEIAILGPKGTFSEDAFKKYNRKNEFKYIFYPTINQVIASLKTNELAIVPLENTLDGYVQTTIDGLLEYHAVIIDEIFVPVQFSLVANAKSLDDIKVIYAQFAAQGQCQKFLNENSHFEILTTQSNSSSLSSVEKGILGEAAIIPIHLLNKSKFFYIENITDQIENETRFVVISKESRKVEHSAYRVSIMVFPIEDRPGLLFDILKIFKDHQINLTSIMSRPTKKVMGQYHFYIEMKLSSNEINLIMKAIDEINLNYDIHVLGIYPAKK